MADDLNLFNSVNNKLLNPPGQSLRHIPVKVYLPTKQQVVDDVPGQDEDKASDIPQPGSVRVVQTLVSPYTSTRTL